MKSQRFSPGKVSGPVPGQTCLSPLVTSAPWTLAEALRALPSPEDVPKPLTPPSPVPVIVAPPAVEYLPYHHSPRLAPITNLSENGRKLLQKMSGVAPQVRGNTESPCLAPITNTGSPRLAPITNLSENSRKLLQEMAQKMTGVYPQEGKVKRKRGKAKKRVKQEQASNMKQVENVGESKEDKKEENKSLRKRNARNMARDVQNSFYDIVEEVGGLTHTQAVAYIKKLMTKGRYSQDVWS
ncbi:hypothetical protein J4Q44_G00389730 [Coregonus suidteri]|uniref:Uncharacterized protein n=1 Tax=Coregonus suidteri TaxID=861788 RepID=A0AAN8Q3S8_9TELE